MLCRNSTSFQNRELRAFGAVRRWAPSLPTFLMRAGIAGPALCKMVGFCFPSALCSSNSSTARLGDEGGQGRGPGRGPNLCSLGVPASSRGTVQLHDALNKPVFFKMRIASHFCVFKIFLLLKFQNTTEGKSVISCHPGTVPQLQ